MEQNVYSLSALIRMFCFSVSLSFLTLQSNGFQKLWLLSGMGDKSRYVAVHNIAAALGDDKAGALSGFHAFTGRDTVSFFFSRSKKTAWRIWISYPAATAAFTFISKPQSNLEDAIFQILGRFTALIYDSKTESSSVNETIRKDHFATEIKLLPHLPPTHAALHQHILRAAYQAEKKCLSCRDVLWYLVFGGFAIYFMQKLNLNLTIIAMVVAPQLKATALSQCALNEHKQNSNSSSLWANDTSFKNALSNSTIHTSITSRDLSQTVEHSTSENQTQFRRRFIWNEYDRGVALGAYFWVHWITELPAGILTHRYGTKLIFGLAIFISSALGFLIPVAARHHFYAFVLLRALQGAATGACYASMHSMAAKWIPVTERSKFISAYTGGAFGAAVTYPMCATLINSFGWESVFYVTSAFGIIWCVAWYFLAFDTPQEHPRISSSEKKYILECIGTSVNVNTSRKVPWKAILTSGPVWMVTIAHVGLMWCLNILTTGTPSYFNYIHGWNIKAGCLTNMGSPTEPSNINQLEQSIRVEIALIDDHGDQIRAAVYIFNSLSAHCQVGILSAIPYVSRLLASYMIASFSDWLLKTKRMSLMWLRKSAVVVSHGIPSMMLLGLAFSGCYPTLAILFMIGGLAASGACSAGTLAITVDLSPNYASIIVAIMGTIGSIAGFVAPMMIGILTNNNQTIVQWRVVFLITVAIIFSTGAVYIFFGTSEVQPWNYKHHEEDPAELETLRSKVNEVDGQRTTADISQTTDNCSHPEDQEYCAAKMNE